MLWNLHLLLVATDTLCLEVDVFQKFQLRPEMVV